MCRNIKICCNLFTFWKSLDKKVFFLGVKKCFFCKRCTISWYILHIILIQICKFAITRKNNAFVVKIVNTRLTQICMPIFALAKRLPTSATLQSYMSDGMGWMGLVIIGHRLSKSTFGANNMILKMTFSLLPTE